MTKTFYVVIFCDLMPQIHLTEVIFKYVVVMKPTKLGIWFKLGFWDVYSEVLSDTSWLESMCTTSRNIRGTYSHWSEISGCFKRHDLDLEMTLLWVKVNLMGTNPAHTSLVVLAYTSPKNRPQTEKSGFLCFYYGFFTSSQSCAARCQKPLKRSKIQYSSIKKWSFFTQLNNYRSKVRGHFLYPKSQVLSTFCVFIGHWPM